MQQAKGSKQKIRDPVATAELPSWRQRKNIDSLVHRRPPEASESGDNCFRRQSRGFIRPTTSHRNRIGRPIKNRQNEAGYHLDLLRRRRGHRNHISSERKGLQKSGNRKSDHSWRHKCVEPLVEAREKTGGQAYRDFLDKMGFHILNTGSTPTFETYRGDRICSSIVDVTACSSPLIGRVENWRVDRTATTSDHNAIVFNLRLRGAIKPMEPITTRKYNTNKTDWTEFCLQLRNTLLKYGIAEKVERLKRPEDLEANSKEYIAAIQEVCEEIFPKIGQRKTKANPPWWTAELSALKKDVLRKKRRIRNAAPTRKKAVVEEYLTTKTIYTQKSEIAQTESWKEYCTTQDKESMWDKVYRVLSNKKGRLPDTLLRNSEGKTLSPHESAKLLAYTFYPDDSVSTDMPFHIRTRERIEDKPVEDVRLSEDDPPFTMVELKAVLRELNPKKAPGPDGLTQISA
ncbi:Retrovirus-related Pol polyprotein from type-1 retrotransposable element R1 [Eumeta japonica]|uniref:Retrovirus-related Pol polyprotein from type-1 retrotransposable element R1 n=1 Tax=Eumeta variegata TaxID=151549 RepID=A0A4C1XF24_EUMVA|nr:Retrovirus-related Pol polyprotein from type-1 retrotransposable element R1 [Eumeta japonica]